MNNIAKQGGKIMVERSQIFKCEMCGNIVVVLHGGAGALVLLRKTEAAGSK